MVYIKDFIKQFKALDAYKNASPRNRGRGKILFDVSGRKYSAEVVVGFTKSGICELHDVVNINTTTFEYKKRATSKSKDSEESTQVDMTSTNTILPSSEKVNNKNSIRDSVKDSEYLELAKNPEKNEARLGEWWMKRRKRMGNTSEVLYVESNKKRINAFGTLTGL